MADRAGPSGIRIEAGVNGMERLVFSTAGGARAEIYRHGAQVTRWTPAGGMDQLYLSPQAVFAPGEAIRGGVPVIFPQFGGRGPLPKHGFARRVDWEYLRERSEANQGPIQAWFRLVDTPFTRQTWPYAFQAELDVTLDKDRLEQTLRVLNPGDRPFTFTAALHTYLSVVDIRQAVLDGLEGHPFTDSTRQDAPGVQEAAALAFDGSEIDRIYPDAPDQVTLRSQGRHLRLQKRGFPDLVVWNPGDEGAARLSDLEPQGNRHFVCAEPALTRPLELLPGASWEGTQILWADPA